MATNSILRTVSIKDRKLVKSFIEALENAKNKKSQTVIISKKVKHLDKADLDKVFPKNR